MGAFGKPEMVGTYVAGFHNEDAVKQMMYNPLGRTGMCVSDLGFGGCSFGDFFVEKERGSADEVITTAMKAGINYFDTAPWYVNSERIYGNVLVDLPRSAYYIATKVGRYPNPPEEMFDFTYRRTVRSIGESYENLRSGAIDLVQIHDPEFAPSVDVLAGTLRALEEARAAGQIRAIGITGYSVDRQREILALARTMGIDIMTSLTYARISLIDDFGCSWAEELSRPDAAVGGRVAMINASTLALGALTPQGAPDWFTFPPADLLAATREIREDAAARGIDLARVALSRAVEMSRAVVCEDAGSAVPAIPMTLTGCYSPEIVLQNIAATRPGALSSEEVTFADYAQGQFRKLPARHWEGAEVQKYFVKMGKRAILKASYPRGKDDGLPE